MGGGISDVTYYSRRIIVPYKPKMILFYAGENDLVRGRSPGSVLADFDFFMKKLRMELPDVTTGFISIKPSPGRIGLLDRIRTSNKLIEQYTTEHKRIKYIDVFTPMIDKTGAIRKELFDRNDDVHMNKTGYQVWRSIIAVHLNNAEVPFESVCGKHLPVIKHHGETHHLASCVNYTPSMRRGLQLGGHVADHNTHPAGDTFLGPFIFCVNHAGHSHRRVDQFPRYTPGGVGRNRRYHRTGQRRIASRKFSPRTQSITRTAQRPPALLNPAEHRPNATHHPPIPRPTRRRPLLTRRSPDL